MWAMFAKVNDDWRFEGFQEHDEIVTEIEETVVDENGEGSFFSVELPA
jgi:hypothetical protein